MAGNKQHRARVERERMLSLEPETLESICEHVANRGSLGSWCKKHDVRFRFWHGWLHDDKQRLSAYTKAMEGQHARLEDKVRDRMELLLDADVRQAFGPKNRMKNVRALPDSIAGAVTEISDSPRGGPKLKLVAPDRAVELAGRHLGMFRERVELEVTQGLSTRLAAARQRAAKRK